MPIFTYKAADISGKILKNRMIAPDEQTLEMQVERAGQNLIDVLSVGREVKGRSLGRISNNDQIEMAYHLSVMCAAGIPILNALEDYAAQRTSPRLKKILEIIIKDINTGSLLSEAIARHPNTFDGILVNLVKAGEASGSLDTVMERFYKELEWRGKVKSKLIQAMVYPCFLILALSGLVVLMLTFLLPKVMGVMVKDGMELPLVTKILVDASEAVRNYWWILLGLAVLVPITVKLVRLTRKGRFVTDLALMHVPALGTVVHDVAVARFISTLRTLLGSGVEMIKALDISGRSAGNEVIQVRASGIIDDVTRGALLSEAFRKVKEFNSMIQSMIGMCEKTGQTPEALERITAYFDALIPRRVKKMISIMEPTIIILAGILVGFVLVGTLMPLFNLYSSL